MAIDCAVVEERIAVEFHGPSHYTDCPQGGPTPGDPPPLEDGRTRAKTVLLQRLGWKVVNLKWWEWKELDGETEEVKGEWLRGEIDRGGRPDNLRGS